MLTSLRRMLATLVAASAACLSLCGAPPAADMGAAREYCDNHPGLPTGIWSFPQDGVTVLVHPSESASGVAPTAYTLTIVESENGSALPGEAIGELQATAADGRYILELRGDSPGNRGKRSRLAARMTSSGSAIAIERAGVDFSIFPTRLLPYLGRLLMVRYKDPAKEVPQGLIRIYPPAETSPVMRF